MEAIKENNNYIEFFGEDYKKKLIRSGKHAVYLIETEDTKYILKKFNSQNNVITNSELDIYELIKDCPYIKKCKYSSRGDSNDSEGFIITEYIDGDSLLNKVEQRELSNEEMNEIACQLLDYIEYCKGVGDEKIKNTCLYSEKKWMEILIGIIDAGLKTIEGLEDCREKSELVELGIFLKKWVDSRAEYFSNVEKKLIPVDLNLNNFIITNDNKVKAIDLDAFLVADPLLCYGELFAHIYGTHLFDILYKMLANSVEDNLCVIHFYAIVCSFSILCFDAKEELKQLKNAKPWGNYLTFYELISYHKKIIENFEDKYYVNDMVAEGKFFDYRKCGINSTRVFEVTDTLNRVNKIKGKAGITRVPDIKDLDYLDIPAFQCIRPAAAQAENTFSVFSGKGNTEDECRVSAIVEGIERFCAEQSNYSQKKVLRGSYKDLKDNYDMVNPSIFLGKKGGRFDEEEIHEWIPAYNLLSGKKSYMIADVVFYPYKPEVGECLLRYFTTGLAAGNTYDEAIHHGLAEVIERDAAALNILLRRSPIVDTSNIKNIEIRRLISRVEENGLNLVIRYISSPDIDIPVFSAIIDDEQRKDTMYISGGYGAHPNKDIALTNAINEAVLSRVSTISGAREDLEKFEKAKSGVDYKKYKEKYKYWFSKDKVINYCEIPDFKSMYLNIDILHMIDCVKNAGFENIYMVDLTNEELLFPVVKIIIPGIERYSWNRIYGARAYRFYEQYKEERG